MGMEPVLYQLMGLRINSIMNGITNSDGEYQAISRKSDEYSDKLDKMMLGSNKRSSTIQILSTLKISHIKCF